MHSMLSKPCHFHDISSRVFAVSAHLFSVMLILDSEFGILCCMEIILHGRLDLFVIPLQFDGILEKGDKVFHCSGS